jgi:hypothetical protein
MTDAEAINKYRKEDVNMLTSQLAKQIDFATAQRQSQWNMDATRAGIASPFAAVLGTMSAAISGASAGASMGQGISKAGGADTLTKTTTATSANTTNQNGYTITRYH